MKSLFQLALCLLFLSFSASVNAQGSAASAPKDGIRELPDNLAGGAICLGLNRSGDNFTSSQIGVSGNYQRKIGENSFVGGSIGVNRSGTNSGSGTFRTSDVNTYIQPEFTQYCGFKESQLIRPYGRLSARFGVGQGTTESSGITSTTNNTHIGGIFSIGTLVQVCDDTYLGADFPIARVDRLNTRFPGASSGSGSTSVGLSAGKAANVSVLRAF